VPEVLEVPRVLVPEVLMVLVLGTDGAGAGGADGAVTEVLTVLVREMPA